MDFKKISKNDKAVSPVIGVVLMVAITVILAAAIGSSVFGQGPSESAPQGNINIIASNSTAIKLEHLGGDTIIFDDTTTKIMLANSEGSYELDMTEFGTSTTFDVGMTKSLTLMKKVVNADGTAGTSEDIEMKPGEFATVKVVDVKTKQLIADKELRF